MRRATAASRIYHRYHAGQAALMLVALLAVIQVSAASRSLLQDGSCSKSSPCPNKSHCCSQYNYCGVGKDYCGDGCKAGPCTGTTPTPSTPSSPAPAGSGWTSFFTKADFEGWFPNRNQGFYTYKAFKNAALAYPTFGTSKSVNDQKREIAAFFGNVQQESGGLKYIEEIDGRSKNYCQSGNTQYPCVSGKTYFGRGPIQLSWNYNYGECGNDLKLNLLRNPDQVAQNGETAFKTALWFWMKRGCHNAIVKSPPSFGGTIKIINGMECKNSYDARVESRVTTYLHFCKSLGVDPGTDLRC